jgi:hypothetical protein
VNSARKAAPENMPHLGGLLLKQQTTYVIATETLNGGLLTLAKQNHQDFW